MPPSRPAVSGPLGAQFLAWEYATAVAGRVLQIDPFNQPNVQESKDNTNALLKDSGDGPLPEGEPAFTDGAIAVYGDAALLGQCLERRRRAGRVAATPFRDRGYLAVMAYLDRFADARRGRDPGAAGRPPRAPGDVRLGAAVPALDRAVPQGRSAGRERSFRSPARRRPIWRSPAGRTPSPDCSGHRRSVTWEPWRGAAVPSSACTCRTALLVCRPCSDAARSLAEG